MILSLEAVGGAGAGEVGRRFPFSPELRRMSVECVPAGGSRLLLAKGSPEALLPLLREADIIV